MLNTGNTVRCIGQSANARKGGQAYTAPLGPPPQWRSKTTIGDICQRLGKGKKPQPAPLQSMPLVSQPFAQVAIDIIGPLPVCQESGNRFVLTVLDPCTHYPEVIPLKQHTAADVAQALGTVFSRFGFPQDSLSD